ncbi:MAG: hypothetical protein WAV38_36960 [Xanthobacteraceae bacterium]
MSVISVAPIESMASRALVKNPEESHWQLVDGDAWAVFRGRHALRQPELTAMEMSGADRDRLADVR